MYETTYRRPNSLSEAKDLLRSSDDPKILAGGHTLLPTMKQRLAAPSHLIDIVHLDDLKGIALKEGLLTIGAAETHASVQTSEIVADTLPALAQLAGEIGDPHVRNMGTIGGSVANNDPAADYPAAVLALNAIIATDERKIPADEYFLGMFETPLADDEIITAIEIPLPRKAAYARFPNPASRYPMAGVFVAELANGAVRVAVTGAGMDGVFRWSQAEAALAADFSTRLLSGLSVEISTMVSDIHGDGAYRANLVSVLARRAVAAV